MIITRTPFRLSFFGGGTDYPAWYQKNGGAVLSTTIDKYCYISCRYLPPFFEHKYRIVYSLIENVNTFADIQHPSVKAVLTWLECNKGLEVHHDGDLPARSGLGSSSSFTVGLINAINALRGNYTTHEQLAQDALYVEQEVIKEEVGSQDQIAAAYGGLNKIEFFEDSTFKVNPVILQRERLDELQDHLVLFFTGVSRYSTDIAKTKIANFQNRQSQLHAMREMVDESLSILGSSTTSILDFGKLLHESWLHKKSLSNKVSTDFIDDIYSTAIKSGALGGKILGAGGGGFIAFFAPPEKHTTLISKLNELIHVPFRFENMGSQVVMYQPNGF